MPNGVWVWGVPKPKYILQHRFGVKAKATCWFYWFIQMKFWVFTQECFLKAIGIWSLRRITRLSLRLCGAISPVHWWLLIHMTVTRSVLHGRHTLLMRWSIRIQVRSYLCWLLLRRLVHARHAATFREAVCLVRLLNLVQSSQILQIHKGTTPSIWFCRWRLLFHFRAWYARLFNRSSSFEETKLFVIWADSSGSWFRHRERIHPEDNVITSAISIGLRGGYITNIDKTIQRMTTCTRRRFNKNLGPKKKGSWKLPHLRW